MHKHQGAIFGIALADQSICQNDDPESYLHDVHKSAASAAQALMTPHGSTPNHRLEWQQDLSQSFCLASKQGLSI